MAVAQEVEVVVVTMAEALVVDHQVAVALEASEADPLVAVVLREDFNYIRRFIWQKRKVFQLLQY